MPLSKYLERKFRNLSCISAQEPLDNDDAVNEQPARVRKSAFLKRIQRLRKNRRNGEVECSEESGLLSKRHKGVKYYTLVECDFDESTQTNRKRVRFEGDEEKPKKKKKKYSLLKKTGKAIVTSCRLMTFSMPTYLQYTPPDYCYPDYESNDYSLFSKSAMYGGGYYSGGYCPTAYGF